MQRAFGEHLKKVAIALHDVEWVLSGDRTEGSEQEAISNVFGSSLKQEALKVLKNDILDTIEELKEMAKTV